MFKEKGITLIALIITIIIMLILTGVTIQMITGGGLVDKAHNAASQTQGAAANEQNMMDIGDDIDDILYPPNAEADFLPIPADFTGTITGYVGSSTNVVIPRTINGVTVTGIDRYAFDGNTSITSLRMPDSIEEIEYGSFNECSSLISVVLPNNLTNIGEIAFQNCSALENITIPNSIEMIGDNAFDGTTFLANLLSSNNGVAISNGVLLEVDNMVQTGSSFVVPDGVKIIAGYAFASCNFTSISLPSSLIRIGRAAFIDCNDLTSIEILSGVTTIDMQAFFHCYALADITIPSSVATIGSDAFKNCPATNMKIAKPTDSISGAPWGANAGYSITWDYTPQ